MNGKTDKTIRIALAGNHEMMRKGIVGLLNKEENLSVITDVSNGSLLLNELRTHSIDVVVSDREMPVMSGVDALRLINERYPSVKVIILSSLNSDAFIIDCVSSGARGFICKESAIEKLVEAINTVYRQGYYFDENMSKALLFQLMENKTVKPNFNDAPLTKREIEVVELICQGSTTKEIAETLFLSVRTVEVHRKNIAKKTNSTSVAGVVIYAIKRGIYKI